MSAPARFDPPLAGGALPAAAARVVPTSRRGGVLFHLLDEGAPALLDDDRWPGVTVLIPAFNEEAEIATSVGGKADRLNTCTRWR